MSVYEITLLLNSEEQPEDIVEHNGKQYRKVKRNAAVGDFIYYPEDYRFSTVIPNDGYVGKLEETFLSTTECHEHFVLELVEQSGQLTERDLIANLAKELAELKRELIREQEYRSSIYVKVSDLRDDVDDLEDRLDENEKDTEEVIGRINDLGDGAEAAAVVSVEAIEKVIAELGTLEEKALDEADTFNYNGMVEQYESEAEAKAYGKAIGLLQEALRNG